jgi:phosphate transport system ATP-binding protein
MQSKLEMQQKLCIACLLPLKPQVILMNAPCSALDAEATKAVEELMLEIAGRYNIVIVTHNMNQVRRISDECIFMLLGKIIEHIELKIYFLLQKIQRLLIIMKENMVKHYYLIKKIKNLS